MQEEDAIRVQRTMEWERVKGGLKGILTTYFNQPEVFQRMDDVVNEFVQKVEGEGLQE